MLIDSVIVATLSSKLLDAFITFAFVRKHAYLWLRQLHSAVKKLWGIDELRLRFMKKMFQNGWNVQDWVAKAVQDKY